MIELVFNLSLTQGEPPKQFSGLATRGAFLNLIRDANPALSTLLHGGYDATKKKRAVFSMKPLTFTSARSPQASFSASFHDQALGTQTLSSLLSKAPRNITVAEGAYSIEAISIKEVHPEIRASQCSRENSFNLRFLTPTYFSARGSKFKVVTPNLTLMLLSIANDMHIHGYKSIPRQQVLQTRRQIGITGLDIHTDRPVREGTKLYPGFKGWVKLNTSYLDDTQKQLLSLMLAWAEAFNVGGNRTAGFGVLQITTKQPQAPMDPQADKPAPQQ